MSDLITCHRAAADALRHQPGNAAAAQCKFHSETADEIERLNKYRETAETRQKEMAEEIERLRSALKEIAHPDCMDEQRIAREALKGEASED